MPADDRGHDPTRWRFERAVARIAPIVEPLLVEHAVEFWMRPLRRVVVDAPPHQRLVWMIDDEPVVEVGVPDRGPSTLIVHDFSVFHAVRSAVRTRHVRIRLATARDVVTVPARSRFTTK